MRLREWLRDEYDIHEKADYYMMMDAMRVIYETYKEQWKRSSRAELNALTRRARALYETARTYRCTPTRLQQWRELKRQPLSPNGIYTRPDGVRIWGTGELVIETKDGPKRPIQTIFGKVMPEGSVPFEFEMEKMLNRAFPEEKPQGT